MIGGRGALRRGSAGFLELSASLMEMTGYCAAGAAGRGKMRKLLDRAYAASDVIAAGFIVGICLTVLVQVVFNIIDKVAVAAGGEAIGLVLPSYAEITGYFLASATFFALAGTFRHGVHIRVTLVIRHLSPRWSRWIESWCCALGLAASAYFAYWAANLVFESWQFGDLSPGILPIPVWIPQLPMALGLACLAAAFADALFQIIGGSEPDYLERANAEEAAE